MTREVSCPSCQNRLRVPAGSPEKWLTCPRCLGSIRNPNDLLTSEAPPVLEPADPARELPPPTCPSCERRVERGWRVCPYCEQELKRPRVVSRIDSLERDVKQDATGGIVVAAVLGTMLLLGIVAFFTMNGPQLLAQSGDAQGVLAVGGIALLVVVIGVVIITFKSRNKAARVVSGVVGGIAIGAGIVGLMVLLACLTLMAVINDFLNTCTKGCH